MTPQERKVFELALEFIERVNKDGWILADFEPQMYAVMTAINEALAKPERTWVGLSTDEFKFIASKYLLSREAGLEYFQEEIETKLKEKNT